MALPTKHTKLNTIEGIGTFYNGGKGSGNFGHSGRPGKRGGAGKGTGSSKQKSSGKTNKESKTITELSTELEEARKKVADNKDPELDAKLMFEAGQARAKLKKAKDAARAVLDDIAGDVMGGDLEDYDYSFEKLIEPVHSKQLTKKQVEQLMLDGKPELSADKKTIYMATRTRLDSYPTSAKKAAEDMKYYRREWKEIEGDY